MGPIIGIALATILGNAGFLIVALPTLSFFVGAFITGLLKTPQSQKIAEATAAKLAAETKALDARTTATNNAILVEIVHDAMSYAENHEADVLKTFSDKAAFVTQKVQSDPRFGGLGIGVDAVSHIIETVWIEFFKDLEAPAK